VVKQCTRVLWQTRIITVENDGKTTGFDAACAAFYKRAIELLRQSEIPFLLGGAYGVCVYTGLARHTKDVDLFIRAVDLDRALAIFEKDGCRTEKTFPHWLAKVYLGQNVIDLIYAAGNGLGLVDDSWFTRGRDDELLGLPVKVMGPEEIIWMKAFVQERERFDGADIAHMIQSCAESIDWAYLRTRFGADWRVLFSFLVLFGYIYPSERHRIPADLMQELTRLLAHERTASFRERICRGTFLSRAQFLPDVNERGYRDARLEARTTMTAKDIALWTAAIEKDNRSYLTKSCG
jgi:Nucleotidyl transferase of unknown function (DUF2204)